VFDIKMISDAKVKFKDLYAKSLEERQKLRETDGYRLALLDIYEMAAAAVVHPAGECLLGGIVIKLATGKIKIQKNIEDK